MSDYIYAPQGRAAEYADLALNTHAGCPHACDYCYVRRVFGLRETTCTPRADLIRHVEREAEALAKAGDQREILLSFLCDPYPYHTPLPWIRPVLEILLGHGLHVGILSKGGSAALADLDLLIQHRDRVHVGASLTCWRDSTRERWEPGAAPILDRIDALQQAHDAGLRTWASLEPILVPEETVAAIGGSAGAVDEYRIGWLNHVADYRPAPAGLPAVVLAALATGAAVGLKRDAWKILVSQGHDKTGLIGRCTLLFQGDA